MADKARRPNWRNMRRYAAIVAAWSCLALPAPVEAQTVVSLGLEAGPTISDFWGRREAQSMGSSGLLRGRTSQRRALAGLVASGRGALQRPREAGRTRTSSPPVTCRTSCTSPISRRRSRCARRFFPRPRCGRSCSAASAWAFRLSCTYDDFPDGSSNQVDCSEAGFDVTSSDFAVVFGGGVDIPAGPGLVLVEGRGTVGLSTIDASGETDVKNRSISFLIGYSIPLSGFSP